MGSVWQIPVMGKWVTARTLCATTACFLRGGLREDEHAPGSGEHVEQRRGDRCGGILHPAASSGLCRKVLETGRRAISRLMLRIRVLHAVPSPKVDDPRTHPHEASQSPGRSSPV